MARTKYADTFVKPARRDGTMSRDEYLLRAHEFAPRGHQLPQAKLLELDVAAIRSAARQREHLKRYITDNLTNKALALRFGISERNIEKIINRITWSHLP
jgi:predicted nucleotidyltransferase